MLVSYSGYVPVAWRKALVISQNERVFEATRAGAAIFLRHLEGQSATSNDLVGGCLGQQGGRRHRIIEPGLDSPVAGELAFRDGNRQALALGIRLSGVHGGGDQGTYIGKATGR